MDFLFHGCTGREEVKTPASRLQSMARWGTSEDSTMIQPWLKGAVNMNKDANANGIQDFWVTYIYICILRIYVC